MAIQDVGTIGAWTPTRLDKHVQNLFEQRNQIAKTSISTDNHLINGALTFSSGDATSADTIVARPSTGILTINGKPIATTDLIPVVSYPVTSVFSRTGAVVATSGDYTAAQVTNAADTASSSQQVFTGAIQTTQLTTTSNNGVVAQSASGSPSFRNFLLASDTQAAFTIGGNGLLSWGVGGSTAPDTTLGRSGVVPPSSGQVGVVTQQAFYSTNTTGGFVYAAPANNAAFLSFASAADANPQFKIFTQGALEWGPGGASGLDLELARITNSSFGTGTFLELLAGSGFGYGNGTGGSVTQTTSFSTGVTLNKPTGQITLFTSATVAGAVSSFTVTNSVVGAADTIIANFAVGTNAGLNLTVTNVTTGSFQLTFHSVSSLASSTRKINFAVIKGAIV